MSKKIIIVIGITVLTVAAVGAYFLYQKNSAGSSLTPEKLLSSFNVQNPNLTSEQAGLFRQRFNDVKKTLEASPDDFASWLYLGVLKKGVNDYEGARDVFIYAGQIRPNASTPFANLADLYAYFLNDPAKAEESIKKAIANDASDPNLYLSLADIYRYKFADGAVRYEQTMLDAIDKFPGNPDVIAPLAAYFRDTDQTQKAIGWYEKLVKLDPANAAAKQDLAELKAKQ